MSVPQPGEGMKWSSDEMRILVENAVFLAESGTNLEFTCGRLEHTPEGLYRVFSRHKVPWPKEFGPIPSFARSDRRERANYPRHA